MNQNNPSNARIAFFGTPMFVTFTLDELERAGIVPDLIVTVPDKPAGRGLLPKASAVKEWAVLRNITIFQPENLKTEYSLLKDGNFDLFIVAGYGKFLPENLLSLPRRGTLNVHPSLLPKYRGPSPIESAILADEKTIGISIILLDEKPDHGPIVAQEKLPMPEPPLRSAVEMLLWRTGGELLGRVIPSWVKGSHEATPQDDSQATFTKKMQKEDGLIDLAGNARENYLKTCAYEGWPGTYFMARQGIKNIRVKIVSATYKNGAFTPVRVIPEGKREMDYADFLRSL